MDVFLPQRTQQFAYHQPKVYVETSLPQTLQNHRVDSFQECYPTRRTRIATATIM